LDLYLLNNQVLWWGQRHKQDLKNRIQVTSKKNIEKSTIKHVAGAQRNVALRQHE
jgi:hypothetical protein